LEYRALEKIKLNKNQKVIITVLDEYVEDKDINQIDEKPYKKFLGLWKGNNLKEIEDALKDTEKVDIDEW
jgi:hypothetical protein